MKARWGFGMRFIRSRWLSATKGLFRALGLEVSFANSAATEQNILRSLFNASHVDFVLDVGANSGQYGGLVRRCGYRGPIVSFEPLAAAHERLSARAAADRKWTVAERAAIGAAPKRTIINVAGNSSSSSLLRMNVRHSEAEPHSAFVGTEEVNIITLDDCIDRYVAANKRGLLKIDTQGYEMEVLRGAQRCLREKIDLVQIELCLAELYDGQPAMLDVCNLLKGHGFTLRDIIPGFKDPLTGRLLQFDGIFRRD